MEGFSWRKPYFEVGIKLLCENNVTIARGEWGGDSGERGLQELL